jgi:2-oxoglutarate dehydrogenase E1 component
MTPSYVSNAHPNVIDAMYEQFIQNPESIEKGWKSFFEGFEFGQNNNSNTTSVSPGTQLSSKEFQVLNLINAYRAKGHLLSDTNPIRPRKDRRPFLSLNDFGLTEADLSTKFVAGNELNLGIASLADILDTLKKIYCQTIGFEYSYIENKEQAQWLRARVEKPRATDCGLSFDKKRRILEKLNGAVGFENFLAKKYVAQKRFGLEGGEGSIAGLDAVINKGSELGIEEFIIGMAHRGRLNVLANIMGKTYSYIFNEFEGNAIPDLSFGDGDVKYHLGYSSQVQTTAGKTVHLKLVPNPSHLEAVNPVVLGFARAKSDIQYKKDLKRIMPILIHGDAAAAGQGILFETIQMSNLQGYKTGGTLHLIINNQVGFTTDFDDARTSTYCSDIAKVVQAPVFHVNGDDPEAIVYAIELATEYRQEFGLDAFIDLVCYRKNGHNEGDDPEFTQPQLYKLIKAKQDPRVVYTQRLIERGEIEKKLAESLDVEFQTMLQDRLDEVRQHPLPYSYQESEEAWRSLNKKTTDADYETSPKTAISKKDFQTIVDKVNTIPEGFNALKKFETRILKAEKEAIAKGVIGWTTGEHLALGSILLDGNNVRLSGQDVKRGTFSHRNAVIWDSETNQQYNRFSKLSDTQGEFFIYNSLLSEYGVLGFEFGYSLASPNQLVIWEAQFGDFANGAQVMIDQFIAAAESKWQRMSGLVMLLPHGYEGQGPEHSSARLERFLQLSAERNMTVANVTTPANFFHLMRRQLARPFRKPLVVMSPKKLLRFDKCVSSPEDFTTGGFQELIDDTAATPSKIKKVVLCSGKIYYDLLEKKEADKIEDIALVRLEQLYPLPMKQLQDIKKKYAKAAFEWVQEEPSNMGAWQYMLSMLTDWNLTHDTRKPSASPASGFKKVHDKEQADIVAKALTIKK